MTNAFASTHCTDCEPGYYCDTDTSSVLTKTKCPAGVYCSGGASSASGTGTCAVGHYCLEGTSVENGIPCAPGTYCATTGLTTAAGSGDCTAGYYCISGATTATPTDGNTGNECPAGYYCPAGSSYPIACITGTYNPNTGESAVAACLSCPDGYQCDAPALTTYSSSCPAQYYCPDQDTTLACTQGHYCDGGDLAPIDCGVGKYNPYTHQSSCSSCPKGYYCAEVDTIVPSACEPGHYCPAGTNSAT